MNEESSKENLSIGIKEEADSEVEDFRMRLELERPFPVKSKPFVSDEFLSKLRHDLGSKLDN